MKKLFACLFSLVLCLSSTVNVFAAPEDGFTVSVSGSGAPGIVVLEGVGNDAIVGYVVDASGTTLSTVYGGCVNSSSLEDAQNPESTMSEATRNELIGLYNQFVNKEIKLSEELEALNALVEEKFGKPNNADNMVVRDLMLVDLIHDECKAELAKEGTTLDITFELNVEKDTFLQVATLINGEWQLVEKVVNNNEDADTTNDGTVTVTFEDLCPVVFLVPGEMAQEEAAGFNWIYVILALIASLIAILLVKKSKKQA